ncbi:hypothetical protein JKP88DRAFT_352606 [Tribonema minus]|uniref:Uncharacterized protein n=1 Tax=Tribonema minus TaxID=303371 RepID=A0A835ZBN1_9STRA|nr:hypothetical protein JKP88DRAFT_352606 [Tribonema minus]
MGEVVFQKAQPLLVIAKKLKLWQTAAFIGSAGAAGDVACQVMEADDKLHWKWNMARTARIAGTGIFVLTPLSIGWNHAAERLFPGRHVKAMLGKLAVQLLCMPPMISIQFASMTLMEGKGWDAVDRKIRQDLLETTAAGACYWPFVGLLNSRFVPVTNRPVVGSFAGLFWNIYLSHKANESDLVVDVALTPEQEVLLAEHIVESPGGSAPQPAVAAAAATAAAVAAVAAPARPHRRRPLVSGAGTGGAIRIRSRGADASLLDKMEPAVTPSQQQAQQPMRFKLPSEGSEREGRGGAEPPQLQLRHHRILVSRKKTSIVAM